MPFKVVPAATPNDLALCLAIEPPTAGVPGGKGLHVIIPADFKTRILLGQTVAGCTYASIEADGSLYVSDATQVGLNDPTVTAGLPAADVSALKAKLVTSPVVVEASVSIEG